MSSTGGAGGGPPQGCASLVRSRRLTTGNTLAISSRTKRCASTGWNFQMVGQGDSTSTKEKPRPLTWFSTARRITLAAAMICLLLPRDTRSIKTGASSEFSNSQTCTGKPSVCELRPNGEVVLFLPSGVVGAIWPPVMP